MKKLFKYSFILLAACMGACSEDSPKGEDETTPDEVPSENESPIVRPEAGISLYNANLSSEEKNTVSSLNSFTYNYFNASSAYFNHNENFSVSPLSAQILLTMLANSIDDTNSAKITQLLGADLASLNDAVKKLMLYMSVDKNGCNLQLANSVWYNFQRTLSDNYLDGMADNFFSEVMPADFFDQQSAKEKINEWAREKTNGLIYPFLEEPLDASTELALYNALYFEDKWATVFDKSKTDKQQFHGTNGTTEIDMMHLTYIGAYTVSDDFEAVVLSYEGPSQMLIILPKEGKSIEDFSKSFSKDDRDKMQSELCEINLSIPKFSANSKIQIDKILPALGVDFSNINIAPTGINRDIAIEIKQKTATEVAEEGVVAAAVTGTDMVSAPGPMEVEKKTFTIDRPFLFFIENTITGTTIMSGRICNL